MMAARSSVKEGEMRLIEKLHVNMGHQDSRKFLRALRAAGVKAHILRWVQKAHILRWVQHEFSCSQCQEHGRPAMHRKVALPRTCKFNYIVAVDLFYINFLGASRAVLNVVDHCTNLQAVAFLPEATSLAVWSPFTRYGSEHMGRRKC